MLNKKDKKEWQVYIIESDDNKLYTGITIDIKQRWTLHQTGKGAKFFRGRQPKKLLYLETGHDKSSASRREATIKKLSKQEKITLIKESMLPHIDFSLSELTTK